MAFWFYCAACTLLIPGVMLLFGWRFWKKPPQNINSFYGYRTRRSMQNRQTWEFAHQTCGKLWFFCGLVLLPGSILVMLPLWGRQADAVGMWCGAVALIQTAILLATIFPVERALKQHFDSFGRKR